MGDKFNLDDKVISIKRTTQQPEGFIGVVQDTNSQLFGGKYPITVVSDRGAVGQFREDELELLSAALDKKLEVKGLNTIAEYTGGSSSYYKVDVTNPTTSESPYQAECNDVIEALGLTFTEGNIFKAIWRIAADRQGKKKKGNNSVYDAEKVVFFAERLLIQEKSKEGK